MQCSRLQIGFTFFLGTKEHFDQSADNSSLSESTATEKDYSKVEQILEDSLDLIPSPSSLVKIQIMGWKVYLRQ